MRTNRHGIKILPEMKNTRAIEIRRLGRKHGWEVIDHQKNTFMLSFVKDFQRMNVYYSKMTVATCIDHPTKGKTQLFRKAVGLSVLEKLFMNPRQHTDKGYYSR